MRVGIVCEGRTDFPLLEQIVVAIFGACEVTLLRPMHDELGKWEPSSWTLVKKWCERGAEAIGDGMAIGGLDIIVIQLDGDLCGHDGLPATPEDVCDLVKVEWIGTAPPRGVVICIPMQSTDTWLAAAFDPTIGESDDPLPHLVRLGILAAPIGGETKSRKSQYVYRKHATQLAATATTLRATLPELDRFMTKLESFRS